MTPCKLGKYSVGVGSHIDAWTAKEDASPGSLEKKVRGVWANKVFKDRSGSGMSSAQRIPYTVPEARKYFAL
ncbi:hypothetical protein MAHJHV57_52540 [Mycobacterium avium subsp. hominissuis]